MADKTTFTPPPNNNQHWKRSMESVVKPKNFKGTLKRLWNITKNQRGGIIWIFILSAMTSLTAMITPYLIGKIIDSIKTNNYSMILLYLLLLCYIGDSIIRLVQGYTMAGISQRMVKSIRKMLFGHFNRMPLSFFDARQHGDLMSRLTNDIDNVSTTISDSLTQLMQLVFTIVGVLCIMLSLNIWLTMVTLLASPLIYIITKVITKNTRALFKKQQAVLGKLNGHIEESISGIVVVKAFCREAESISEFEDVNEELCEVATKALIWSGFLMPIMNVVNNLSFIFVAVSGGLMAVQNMITVGVISSFLLYSRQFIRPLNDIANIYNTLQTAVAGAERVFEIFDEQAEIDDRPYAREINETKGEIVFDDICFGYQKGVDILKHVNLSVKAGTTVAIVGSTGAGKTTIISLMARFYDVTGGKILLDGVDIRDYKRKDLRRCFGIVLQDTALFNMSIMDNIRYGKQNATDEEVMQAAKNANAHSFVSRLPQNYNTIIGEGGNTLSQGEKQLITIARAILADAPIMILDEATSSVDTRTERKIKDAVTKLTKDRTSFIIAHRLSTIRDCDVIVVLEHGEIAEIGNHDELLKLDKIYSYMYKTQLGI